MIKAILIDDERPSREALQNKIVMHCQDVDLVCMCNSAQEGLDAIIKYNPDLVFLDIEMPLMNGFSFLEQVIDRSFQVIFTTAYDHYAIQAIRFSAIDYLVKPIDVDDLKAAVERVKSSLANQSQDKRLEFLLKNLQQGQTPKTLAITTGQGLLFLNFSDITYLAADGNYTYIHTLNQKILSSKTLREFEDILPSQLFFRIHHSYIIHLEHLKEYHRGEGGEVVMRDGNHLPVARRRKDELLETIKRFSSKV
ncbi:MAG TPA: LytTR family DNA-binding domain-containing protein [Flavobacteriales bacterium]|nr:LytTR family DNA-binding domain-containing protein [Flavobacteriales bacterium]HPH82306.1 LytTR family DNA-binding domain-containing protein [Flavobacteriales bacterium]